MSQKVEHDPENEQFVLNIAENAEPAVLEYSIQGDQVMNAYRTFVPPEGRGQGVAGQLAEAAMEFAEKNGYRVMPSCSFVAKFIERNDKYKGLLASD